MMTGPNHGFMENTEYNSQTMKCFKFTLPRAVSEQLPVDDSLLGVTNDSNDGLYGSQCQNCTDYKGELPNPRC